MPNDMPMYKAGLTSGRACRNTAGTAMYDALAANTINKIVLPSSTLNMKQSKSAKRE